jgi:hypothetical protein
MWFVMLPWWAWVLFGVILLPLYMLEMLARVLLGLGHAYSAATPQTRSGIQRVAKWLLFIFVLWFFVPLYLWRRGKFSGLACAWLYGILIAAAGISAWVDPTVPQPGMTIAMELVAATLLIPAIIVTVRRQRAAARQPEAITPQSDSYLIAP